jgi:hypothetical protein
MRHWFRRAETDGAKNGTGDSGEQFFISNRKMVRCNDRRNCDETLGTIRPLRTLGFVDKPVSVLVCLRFCLPSCRVTVTWALVTGAALLHTSCLRVNAF